MAKVATVRFSRKDIEDAIRLGNSTAESLMSGNVNDPALDEIANASDFLSSLLTKDAEAMRLDGVTSIEDYFDDAKKPGVANMVQEAIDIIRNGKPAMTTTASFVTDRDENSDPKPLEDAKIPQIASRKEAEMKKAEVTPAEPVEPTPAPAAPPAAATPAPVTTAPQTMDEMVKALGSEALNEMVTALAGLKTFKTDKAAQGLLVLLGEEYLQRPIQVEDKTAAALGISPQWKSVIQAMRVALIPEPAKTASIFAEKGFTPARVSFLLRRKGSLFIEKKIASWTAQSDNTMKVEEDGGRTPEISQAHGLTDDNTGISRPSTVVPAKFAGDISANSAVKKAEGYANQLRNLYLEAKQIASVNETRPVRDALETIYAASVKMGEAIKTLANQARQEEDEKEAQRLDDKKKEASVSFGGLVLASEEEEEESSEE